MEQLLWGLTLSSSVDLMVWTTSTPAELSARSRRHGEILHQCIREDVTSPWHCWTSTFTPWEAMMVTIGKILRKDMILGQTNGQ